MKNSGQWESDIYIWPPKRRDTLKCVNQAVNESAIKSASQFQDEENNADY